MGFLSAKEQLTVSIAPQKYVLEKIVGDKFDINVMVNAGSSPHIYEPKTSQMVALSKSKIYFYIGIEFENAWMDKFKKSSKNTLFVDSSAGIEKIAMTEHKHEDEKDTHHEEKSNHKEHNDYEHEHEHEHEGLDPHIWLDPILVKTMAKNIYESVSKIDNSNADFYKTNYENLLKELDNLDAKIKEILKPYAKREFLVFHPSWGYFAKRYDLEQIAIEVEGKEPKPAQIVKITQEAKKHNINVILVSPQFSQKSAEVIAQNINGSVVAIDTLTEKWDNAILETAEKLANSYK